MHAADYSREQYHFVKDSRKVLFDYCSIISPENFVNSNSSFGRGGSIRNLLVHVANTYEYWIANVALHMNIESAPYEMYQNIEDVIRLYNKIDEFVMELINDSTYAEQKAFYKINETEYTASMFKLFTHVTTH